MHKYHSLCYFSSSKIDLIFLNLTNLSTDLKATFVSSCIDLKYTILSILYEETGPTISLCSL